MRIEEGSLIKRLNQKRFVSLVCLPAVYSLVITDFCPF